MGGGSRGSRGAFRKKQNLGQLDPRINDLYSHLSTPASCLEDDFSLGRGGGGSLAAGMGLRAQSPRAPGLVKRTARVGAALKVSVSSESSELAQGPDERGGEGGTLNLDRRALRPRGSRP